MLYYIKLYCIVLYIILYCIVLYIILYYIILHYIILYYIIAYYIILYYVLYIILLYYIISYYIIYYIYNYICIYIHSVCMSCFTWCNSLPRPGYPHFDHLSSAQKSRLLEIFLGGIGESLHDVVPNGAGKKHRLLRDCGPVDWQSMGWREKLGLERCHIIYDNWLIDESNMIFIYIYML